MFAVNTPGQAASRWAAEDHHENSEMGQCHFVID